MEKNTLKIFMIVFLLGSYVGVSQTLNHNPFWPNPNWTLSGTFTAGGVVADPTTVNLNFTFDDDTAGNGSFDDLQATSPALDLTPASTAGETWVTISGGFVYRALGGDVLNIEIYDADAMTWSVLHTFARNTTTTNFLTCNGLSPYTTPIIDISAYTATQLSGFRFRFTYDDNDGWQWGFCVTSPFVRSATPPPSCLTPSALIATNIEDFSADLGWTEAASATLWNVEVVTAGTTPTGIATNMGVSNPFTVTGLMAETAYEFYVQADCGAVDGTSAYAGGLAFTTLCATFIAPYTENFDTAGALPNCWSQGASNAEDWLFADGTLLEPENGGNAGAIVDHTSGTGFFAWVNDTSPDNTGTTLESPFVDVSGLTVPALSFWINSNNEGNTNVDFSVDFFDGAAWNTIYTSSTNTGGWLEVIIDLSVYTITGDVKARFIVDENNGTDFYDDFAIDDVSFEEKPSCLSPIGLTSTNITVTTADLGWTEIGTATLWNIEVVTAGSAPTGTATNVGVSNPFTATGLTAVTAYEFYVQAGCGAAGTSVYEGPYAFTTLCATFTAPYIENFDNAGAIPSCWLQGAANAENWLFADGTSEEPAHGGNAGAIVDYTSGTGYFAWVNDSSPESTGTTLESPFVDVSGLAVPALSFWINSNNEGNTNVDFSVDFFDGATWNTAIYTSNTNTGGWMQVIINLSAYTITGDVKARFIVDENNGTDFYDDFAIDDVTINELPCLDPSGLTATSITETTADFGWTENGATTSWNIELVDVTAGGTFTGTPTASGVTTIPYNQTGLVADNAYRFFVQADCGVDGTSMWVGPFRFSSQYVAVPPDCTNGIFLDSGGINGDYGFSENITYTICPDLAGDVVEVEFTAFSTENDGAATCFDGLTIHNGADATATTVDPPGGGTIWCYDNDAAEGTGDLLGQTITSTDASGCLTFVFTSDGDVQLDGWEAIVNCNTLSTISFGNGRAFTYFPNPVANKLTLVAGKQIENVTIYNILGAQVLTTAPNSLTKDIDTSKLTTGTYFVQVTVDGATDTIKIIKQ
ncbi:T9SS type A sorting domain-containing protein [Kordia sp. YSTF-M3]|uniref:T9SS type A sorting domain-containing protein n=1 Tax=Kordia aestuariivivens TaxID=2759037 RepID=A0ABR7QE85_9FLAO|nr:T9SS type A sorting domain-containing protein [Kordia aestuariivivens]MBC8756696.1 T9SS type A sorting domain-containing protein [Kordia aestuariivivens]